MKVTPKATPISANKTLVKELLQSLECRMSHKIHFLRLLPKFVHENPGAVSAEWGKKKLPGYSNDGNTSSRALGPSYDGQPTLIFDNKRLVFTKEKKILLLVAKHM